MTPRVRAGFVEDVRQELGGLPLGEPALRQVELGMLLRLGADLHRRADATGRSVTLLELTTPSGVVARRVFALLRTVLDQRPDLWIRAPGGVRTVSTYGVTVPFAEVGSALGLADAEGRPSLGMPASWRSAPEAAIRAAVLACGSVSTPGRAPHAEFRVTSETAAEGLAEVIRTVAPSARASAAGSHRVVVKSGAQISDLLGAAGALRAQRRWDEQRSRKEVRRTVTQLANADAANLRRAAAAAADQVQLVQEVVEVVGWAALDDDLRDVALARLANPSATLAELGELCDPPVGKSAIHRRIARLRALRDAAAE